MGWRRSLGNEGNFENNQKGDKEERDGYLIITLARSLWRKECLFLLGFLDLERVISCTIVSGAYLLVGKPGKASYYIKKFNFTKPAPRRTLDVTHFWMEGVHCQYFNGGSREIQAS